MRTVYSASPEPHPPPTPSSSIAQSSVCCHWADSCYMVPHAGTPTLHLSVWEARVLGQKEVSPKEGKGCRQFLLFYWLQQSPSVHPTKKKKKHTKQKNPKHVIHLSFTGTSFPYNHQSCWHAERVCGHVTVQVQVGTQDRQVCPHPDRLFTAIRNQTLLRQCIGQARIQRACRNPFCRANTDSS